MEKLKIKIEEAVDNVSRLENIVYIILLAVAFLMPIFFIPSVAFPFQFSKSVFVSLMTITAFVLWIIARLKDGRFAFPNNIIFGTAVLVLVSALVSSLLSPVIPVSMVGQGFEVGTLSGFFVMFVMMFLFSVLFRPKDRVFYLYLTLFFSFSIIAVFYVLRFLFGADFLSFGLFTNITSNLIGKWNDLGIFFSLVTILTMITLELLPLNKLFNFLVSVIFGLSLLALVIVNFPTIWYTLLFFSVVFSVYFFVFGHAFKKRKNDSSEQSIDVESFSPRKRRFVSIPALFAIIISLVFLADSYTNSRPISVKVANVFNISHLEVRPNWSSTLYVAKKALVEEPFFGAGLNRFTNKWLAYKPSGINESIFWNTDFTAGIGLLPTMFITSGIVGGLSWILFLLAIVFWGLRIILSPINDPLTRYLSISSFFASVSLWTFFVFYTPSFVIVSFSFLFTGIFLASLYNDKIIKAKIISFSGELKTSFISVLVLIVVLMGVVALGYVFAQKFMAVTYFQKALIAFNNEGDIDKAEDYAKKSLSLNNDGAYGRFLSDLMLMKINRLLLDNQAGDSIDAIRADFQLLLGEALNYSRGAVDSNNTDYRNWVSLGRVYEAVVPLGIENAYESAITAYDNAVKLNPSSPLLDLNMARLELARQDTTKAKERVNAALEKKFNYTEALFLKSQIQASEGNLREAIASVEDASVLAPNDSSVFFQLGLLKYNNNDYRGAGEALLRAVFLEPNYSNAKYFLGLSYEKLGMKEESLAQFRDILVLNPGNPEVQAIMRNIEAGFDPFHDTAESVRPENRDTLPIEEGLVEE